MIGIEGRFAVRHELDSRARTWPYRKRRRTRRRKPLHRRRRPDGWVRSNGWPFGKRAVPVRWSPSRDAERAPSASGPRSRRTTLPFPDALAQALCDAALVVVQAPAGYGKTTAARAALDGASDVAWYDAQPWEAGAFAEALLARVRDVRPDVGRLTLALAEQRADPERIGATLAEELRHVDAPLRIVVDDAHVLGPSFAAFARSLVRRMPEAVRVVLLARGALDVGLPEAVAAGRGALIDAAALRFDVAGTRSLAATLGVSLDEGRARALVDRTEGWPIAVPLALRAPESSDALLADVAPLEAYAHIALGDFESGERIANGLIEAWSSSDDLMRYSGALVWGARFALLRGDTTAAYELAREAERIARPFGLRPQAAALHGTLAEAALHVGDTVLARHEARAALMPIDAADAVWLSSAAELLDAFGGGAPVTQMRYVPFDALIARRAEIGGGSFETQLIERLGAPHLAGHTSAPVALPVEALTAREAEILALLASGLTNREIAQRLVLSARTVETHVARVTGKLGVNSRARAVARAVALGLVTPSETAV
jgi:ATP/maltotriose-dependent transcriptional regulator MalT